MLSFKCYEYLMTEWVIDTFSLHSLRLSGRKAAFSSFSPYSSPPTSSHIQYAYIYIRLLSQATLPIIAGFYRLEKNHFTFSVFQFRGPLCFLCGCLQILGISYDFLQVGLYTVYTHILGRARKMLWRQRLHP